MKCSGKPPIPHAGKEIIMPTLTINGESRTLPDPLTAAQLLERLGYDRRRVAVEVNGAVVPLARHGEEALADGDHVEVVTLVGGGGPDAAPEDKPLVGGKF